MTDKLAYRITELVAATGVSKATINRERRAGRLVAFKVGRLTLISRQAAEKWLRLHMGQSFENNGGV